MNGIRTRLVTTVAVVAVLLAVFAGAPPAGAADGRQSPDPTLNPDPVATATTPLELSVTGNAICDDTGAAGWRAHTFIVNTGVNIASLDFTVSGLPAGWVGADFDSVSDGTVQAPLFKGNAATINIIPATSPAGQISPSTLAGFTFSSSSWMLADGDYQIGFVCVDAEPAVRQWWTRTITVDADATPNPFLRTATTTPTTTTTTTVLGQTTTTTGPGQTTTTTIPDDGTTTTTTPDDETTSTTTPIDPFGTGDGSGTGGGSGSGSGDSGLPTTGIGLGSAALGLALLYVGRVLYLLSRRREVTQP